MTFIANILWKIEMFFAKSYKLTVKFFSKTISNAIIIIISHGRSQPKIKGGGGNFLKLIYSAVFNDGKKLEGW